MNITYTTIHPQAHAAIIASCNWKIWGRDAAVRYCRNRGVPLSLLRLARQLQVATMKGF